MAEKNKNKKSRNRAIVYLIPMALVFLIYGNALNHGFVLDDEVVFTKNQFVQQGFSGIPDIFSHGFLFGFNQKNDQSYRPIVLLNFAIEKQLFGNNPKIHHFFNILFYGIACSLLLKLLLLLFQTNRKELVWVITILFLVHPIHTEVVANIKGRDEIIHLIFYLTSLIYLFHYFDQQNKRHLYLSCLMLFFAALSKEMAITALAVFPLCIYAFREVKPGHLFKIGSYLLIPLLLYFSIRVAILDTTTFGEPMSLINNTIAGAESIGSRVATSLFIFIYYLKLFLWPHPLSWDYSYPFFQIREMTEPTIIFLGILVLASFITSVYFLVKNKSRIAFGFLFFIFSFSVVSNFFILIGSTLGERFLFLPSIGLIISLAFIVKLLLQELNFSTQIKSRAFIGIFAIIILTSSIKTIDRNKDWESNKALFSAGINATPNSSRAVSAYASTFREVAESNPNPQLRLNNFQEAIKWYRKSIDLYPDVADTWYNLGVCYMGLNQNNLALEAFEKSLDIDSNGMNALNNVGVIYFKRKDYIKAESYFKRCLAINSNFSSAYANLGAVYHNLGELNRARENYQKALALNPNDANTKNNLNRLLNN